MAIFRYLFASSIIGGIGMRTYYKSIEPKLTIKKAISLSK